MYKAVFKEKRGDDIVISMQRTADSVEVDEVIITKTDFERISLNTLQDRLGFLRSVRVRWQKLIDAASLFDGLTDADVLPAGAQVIADDLSISDADALVYYQTLSLASATTFYNWVRTPAGLTKLRTILPDLV